MRIIDEKVTGNKLSEIGLIYHEKLNKKTKNNRYNRTYAAGRIEKFANDPQEVYQLIFGYLTNNIERLFYGDLTELKDINTQVELIINRHNLPVPNYDGTTFSKVFNYEWFRGKTDIRNDWFKTLGIKVCPYCNRSFLAVAEQKKPKGTEDVLYFDIDHFFPKEKYPWLALSFYNLIPSCTICNQRIKGKKELNLTDHIHPFEDDMDKLLKFSVPVNSLDVFFSNTPISGVSTFAVTN